MFSIFIAKSIWVFMVVGNSWLTVDPVATPSSFLHLLLLLLPGNCCPAMAIEVAIKGKHEHALWCWASHCCFTLANMDLQLKYFVVMLSKTLPTFDIVSILKIINFKIQSFLFCIVGKLQKPPLMIKHLSSDQSTLDCSTERIIHFRIRKLYWPLLS